LSLVIKMEIETIHAGFDEKFELKGGNQPDNENPHTIVNLDLSTLPLEVLEQVLSFLTDPISQRRLSQVCKLWRETVARLRWLRLMSFERKLHLRLPLAGSLHEVHGNQGFSLLLCVDSPVLLAGTAVFLPYRENLHSDVSGEVQLVRHGTPHVGPIGEKIISSSFHVTKEKAMKWQEDCDGKTLACLQGPWLSNRSGQGGTLGGACKGLHPMPVMFKHVMELEPNTRYLLTLKMVEEKGGVVVSDQIGTVWGFQGVPRRKKGPDQNHFRWFQVYRPGLSSSVTSGQFPIIYYIA